MAHKTNRSKGNVKRMRAQRQEILESNARMLSWVKGIAEWDEALKRQNEISEYFGGFTYELRQSA